MLLNITQLELLIHHWVKTLEKNKIFEIVYNMAFRNAFTDPAVWAKARATARRIKIREQVAKEKAKALKAKAKPKKKLIKKK